MSRYKIMLIGVFVVFIGGLLVTPAFGERTYRANPQGTPRWILVPEETTTEPVKPETKKWNLLGGAFWLIGGAYNAVEDSIRGLLTTAEEEAVKEPFREGERRFVPNRTGSGLRWKRKY